MVGKDILGLSIVCAFTTIAGMVVLAFTVGPIIGGIVGAIAGVAFWSDRRNEDNGEDFD